MREGAKAHGTVALRRSQSFVYRELTERVIIVISVDTESGRARGMPTRCACGVHAVEWWGIVGGVANAGEETPPALRECCDRWQVPVRSGGQDVGGSPSCAGCVLPDVRPASLSLGVRRVARREAQLRQTICTMSV